MPTMPTIFVAHNAPLLALDQRKGADYAAWANAMPRPSSILVISAHWESQGPLLIGTTQTRPLMYDFYGFPEPLYQVSYPAPGAPELATLVEQGLRGSYALRREPERPLDHGVWVPLLHMYPKADVPVLQISLPRDMPPRGLFELGRALAFLSAENVLIMASGSLTHNLRHIEMTDNPTPDAWAAEFDAWLADKLTRRDLPALFDYRNLAPHAAFAHPTDEHLTPLFLAMGAASSDAEMSFPLTGFEHRNISRRCVQFG